MIIFAINKCLTLSSLFNPSQPVPYYSPTNMNYIIKCYTYILELVLNSVTHFTA